MSKKSVAALAGALILFAGSAVAPPDDSPRRSRG